VLLAGFGIDQVAQPAVAAAMTAQIAELDTLVAEPAVPLAALIARLVTISGVGQRTAEVIVAQAGGDMTRFPLPGSSLRFT
jgi:3-methyladenine DNA glycosylase/8-oxoguanine DNA glycosylase